MTAMPDHLLVAKAIQQSFRNWAKKDLKFKKHFKVLSDQALSLIDDGLSECGKFEPYYWDVWYQKNHMRYYRMVRNEEMRMVHQMLYNFLSLYAKGRLHDANNGSKTKVRKSRQSLAKEKIRQD